MAAEDKDLNRDPLNDEPGSHPVGTGVGAAGGAVAGAAVGVVGGPVGMAVGGVVGAVIGGLAGKAAAEAVNPTAEEAYWRENYEREPYYQSGRSFDDYGPAYRHGLEGRGRYQDWDEAEPYLASEWETRRGGSSLDWKSAQPASRAAWDRVDPHYRGDRPDGNLSHYGTGMVSSDSSYHTGGPGVTEDDKASFEGRPRRHETPHVQSTRTGTTPVGSATRERDDPRYRDERPDGNLSHYGTGMVSSDSSYHTGGPGVTEDDKASFEGRPHRDETTHMQSTGTGTTNVGSGSMGWGSMGATSTMTGGTLAASSGMDSSYSSGTMTGHDLGTSQADTSDRMGSPGANADVRGAAASVGGMQQGSRNDSGSTRDTIDVLKDLVETCKDGEYGFQQCAEHARREDLRSMFRERAEDCRRGATQLQDHIRRLGGDIPDSGSMLGSVHRGWVATKAAMTSFDDKAMLGEAERGEDNALARYRKALQKPLPEPVREVVQRQCDGVQRNHDQVKRLRDQLRAQG